MQIAPINSYSNSVQRNNVGFKSAVPVFIMIGEDVKTALPAVSKEYNNRCRIKTINMLKDLLKKGVDKERDSMAERLRIYFKKGVTDFYGRYVTAFTCVDGGLEEAASKEGKDVHHPTFYLVTGETAEMLNKERKNYVDKHKESNWNETAEVEIVNSRYYTKGKSIVQNAFKNFHPFNNPNLSPHALYVYYRPVRKKNGEIDEKAFRLFNAKFKPVNDVENPTIELNKLV